VIIAAAGGAAHLAGVCAAHTVLPVLGVPMESASLKGMDSLLSTVQMPAGIPVGTLAIGGAGARNAALLAVAILATSRPELREKLREFRREQSEKVLKETLPYSCSRRAPPAVLPRSARGGGYRATARKQAVGPLRSRSHEKGSYAIVKGNDPRHRVR
jgi:hypothetical protein